MKLNSLATMLNHSNLAPFLHHNIAVCDDIAGQPSNIVIFLPDRNITLELDDKNNVVDTTDPVLDLELQALRDPNGLGTIGFVVNQLVGCVMALRDNPNKIVRQGADATLPLPYCRDTLMEAAEYHYGHNKLLLIHTDCKSRTTTELEFYFYDEGVTAYLTERGGNTSTCDSIDLNDCDIIPVLARAVYNVLMGN